jgi:metal-responsive CopG/Arc/MetJ family transcriptional regulator
MSVTGHQFARTANENRDAIFVAVRSYVYIMYKKRNVESVVEVSFASTENVFRDASNAVVPRRAITIGVVQGDKQSIKGFVTFASSAIPRSRTMKS